MDPRRLRPHRLSRHPPRHGRRCGPLHRERRARLLLRRALETLRDSGANMVRVGGTMAYESEDFYRLCDELGILVWQDFMFANMDYPADNESFASNIDEEARQQLHRF